VRLYFEEIQIGARIVLEVGVTNGLKDNRTVGMHRTLKGTIIIIDRECVELVNLVHLLTQKIK
jgi:hypothetical protein